MIKCSYQGCIDTKNNEAAVKCNLERRNACKFHAQCFAQICIEKCIRGTFDLTQCTCGASTINGHWINDVLRKFPLLRATFDLFNNFRGSCLNSPLDLMKMVFEQHDNFEQLIRYAVKPLAPLHALNSFSMRLIAAECLAQSSNATTTTATSTHALYDYGDSQKENRDPCPGALFLSLFSCPRLLTLSPSLCCSFLFANRWCTRMSNKAMLVQEVYISTLSAQVQLQ